MFGYFDSLCICWVVFEYYLYDLWNYIVSMVDYYCIVDVQVQVGDFIYVVQGCIGYCDVGYLYWFEVCYWGYGVGVVDLEFDIQQFG